MKKLVLCVALIALVGLGGNAFAVKDANDNVPAATLLLPYFEVDLSTLDGITTLFSVNNASAASQLAHITVWSNSSIPVFDFVAYLSGYDVATFNMRDLLNTNWSAAIGNWYIGDGAWQDGYNFITTNDANGVRLCNELFPFYPNYDANSPGFKAHIQAALTGRRSAVTGVFYGCPITAGENIARGYVTVDVVRRCTIRTAYDAAYFAGASPDILYDNVLWGDYFYVNPAQNFAQGETLVHVEAFPLAYSAAQRTFYDRYVANNSFDFREPLATTYASRFLFGGAFTGGTSLIVWREGGTPAPSASAPVCTVYDTRDYAFFDEEENPWQRFCTSGDPTCVYRTLESQRVNLRALWPTMPYNFGWVYWNLQYAQARQAFVTTVMDANGRFSVGFDAIGLDNANAPITIFINPDDNP